MKKSQAVYHIQSGLAGSPRRPQTMLPLAVTLFLQGLPAQANPQSWSHPVFQPPGHFQGHIQGNFAGVTHGVHAFIPAVLPSKAVSTDLTAQQLNQLLDSGRRVVQVDLNSALLGNVSIPKGVTLIDRVDQSGSGLTVAGNFTDAGRLVFIPADGTVQSATLTANSIVVNQGGTISTTSAPGQHSSLSLNVNTLDGVVNSGKIISGGNLNLVSASGSIQNSGVIKAPSGDVNISSDHSLSVNNAGGLIVASGAINVSATGQTSKSGINITGGNLLSESLNMTATEGTVNTNANNISGIVNVTACNAHIGASSPDLKLGKMDVSGDPTYYNTGGDVNITGGITTNGSPLAILASGNINISGGAIDTTGAGSAGSVLIVAGAAISAPPTSNNQVNNDQVSTVTLTNGGGSGGGSATGGSVKSDSISPINASGVAGGSGGNVQLVSYSGSSSGSGSIIFPSAISTSGNGAGSNGSVSIIGGATVGSAITTGAINTAGSTNSSPTGSITMTTAAPTIVGGDINVQNGAPSGGTFATGSITGGTITTTGNLSTASAGIQIAAGGDIFLGGNVATDAPGIVSPSGTTGNIAILSGGNINSLANISPTSPPPALITTPNGLSAASQSAGDIIVIAGANLTAGATVSQVQVSGGSIQGGSVNFREVLQPYPLFSNAGVNVVAEGNFQGGSSAGGNVTLAAYQGTNAATGQVNLNNYQYGIATDANGNAGNISVIAGAASGTAVTSTFIYSGSSGTSGGGISVINATPITQHIGAPGTVVFNTGTLSSQDSIGIGSYQHASLNLQSVFASHGPLTLIAGANLTIGSGTLPGNITGYGDITLMAPNGTFTATGGGLGPVTANGGNITILAKDIAVSLTGPLLIQSKGAGYANGGLVSITQTDFAPLVVGTATGIHNVQVSASGSNANGGGIFISTGGDLTVDATTLSLTGGANGLAPQLTLAAGTAGTGTLQLNAPSGTNLNLSGGGAAAGGVISLSDNSATTLSVGTSSSILNGGILSANGGTSGAGGTIRLINTGSGGVVVNPNRISVTANGNGNGGTIDLEAPNGLLYLYQGSLSAVPAGTGSGGTLTLRGGSFAFPNGFLTAAAGGTLIIDATQAPTTALNLGNTFTARDIRILAEHGVINTGDSVTGTNSVSLITSGAIGSVAGFNSTPTLVLISTNGAIGTNDITGRVVANSPNVTLNASGPVYFTDISAGDSNGNINLVDANINGITYVNAALSTYSVAATNISTGHNLIIAPGVQVSAGNVYLTSTGGVSNGGDIGGTNIAFISHDTISSVGKITPSATITLATTSPTSTIGTGPNNPLAVNSAGLTVSSLTSAWITDTPTAANASITLANATIDGISYTNSATGTYSLQAPGLAAGTSVILSAGNNLTATDFILSSSAGISIMGSVIASNSAVILSTSSIRGGGSVTAPAVILATTGAGANIGTDPNTGRFSINSVMVTAQAAGSVWLTDSSPAASGAVTLANSTSNSIAYSNSADPLSGTFSLIASNAPLTMGSVVVSANTVQLVASGNSLTATAGNIAAQNILLGANLSSGTVTLTDSAIVAQPDGTTGNGGSISIQAFDIASALPLSLSANGSGTGNGGQVTYQTHDPASNLVVAPGSIVITAQSGLAGGNGGFATVAAGGNLTFDSAAVSADPAPVGNGNGAHISVSAAGGLTLSNSSYAYNGVGTKGNGGLITFQGNTISATPSLILSVNGSGTGNGGSVALYSLSSSSNLSVAVGAFQVSAVSGKSGGNGGIVSVTSGGSLSYDSAAVMADPSGSGNGRGAQVSMIAGSALSLTNSSYTYNGAGSSGMGGLIDFEGATITSGSLTLSTNGVGIGAGGFVKYVLTGAAPVTLASGGLIINATGGSGGSSSGDGGTVTVTLAGNLIINPSALSLGPLGINGSGGDLYLSAKAITSQQGPTLTLSVQGGGGSLTGTGNGGILKVFETTTTPQSIGTSGSLSVDADAGKGGGNAGVLSISTGGNLTVNSPGLAVLAYANGPQPANGGLISLVAGQSGAGALIVLGNISADRGVNSSNSSGAGVIKLQADSSTALSIGSNITLSANSLITLGDISVTNQGGPVNIAGGITAKTIELSTGNNGSISVTNAIGVVGIPNPTTTINLNANGNGSITISADVRVDTLNLTSGSGDITLKSAKNVSQVGYPSTLNANTGGNGKVAITTFFDPSVGFPAPQMTINSLSGASVSVSSSSPVLLPNAVTAGSISLSSTRSDFFLGYAISVNAPLTATSGTVTLSGPGVITNAPVFGFAGVNSSGVLQAKANISTGSGGIVNLLGAVNTAGVDISAGKSVTIGSASQPASTISVGTIGAIMVPVSVSFTGSNISSGGAINAQTSVKFVGVSNSSGSGKMLLASPIDVANGAITLSSSGDITTTGDLNASSVAISSTAGSVTVAKIGSLLQPNTISLTGGNVIVNGKLNAIDSVTLKGVSNPAAYQLGSVTIANDISVTKSTGTITVISGTYGTITDSAPGTTLTSSKVTFTGPAGVTIDGNIASTSGVSITSTAGFITTGALADITSAASSVNLTALTNIADYGSINAATSVSIKTTQQLFTDSLSFANVTTKNGTLSVLGAGGSVTVLSGAQILVKSANSATINIGATNTKFGSVVIQGGQTSIATDGAKKGAVNIFVGQAASVAGNPLSGVIYIYNSIFGVSPSAPPFYFGKNFQNVTVAGFPTEVTLNSQNGGTISFNSAARPITLDTSRGQILILSDPPAAGASTTKSGLSSVWSIPNPQLDIAVPSLSLSSPTLTRQSSASYLPTLSNVPIGIDGDQQNIPSVSAQLGAATGQSIYSLISANAGGIQNNVVRHADDIVNGLVQSQIPVQLISEDDFGIKQSKAAETISEEASTIALRQGRSQGLLQGIVSTGPKTIQLRRGNVLLAPGSDSIVDTPFGTVRVAGHSLVLVMLSDCGLSVFNLDDRHSDSALLTTGNQTLSLCPGRHATITHAGVTGFEKINPAIAVGYCRMTERELGLGLKAYISSFSAHSLVSNVPAIRQMLNSSNPNAQKATSHLLKTVAILSQLGANEPYYQMIGPPMTAMR